MLARLRNSVLVFVLAAVCGTVLAQGYPVRPVRLISPFPPGGGNDIFARAIAPKLGEYLGQQVLVDNRPGANTIIGTDLVAKSAADGYTLLIASGGHAINSSLYPKLPYDTVRDFAPITLVGAGPLMLAVHPSLPARSVRELTALAKSKPAELTYASAGSGSVGHLAIVLIDMMAGIQMTHIPYKGVAPALADVIGGQVRMVMGTPLALMPQVNAGKLRALATTGAKRSQGSPDIPAIAEDLPGYEAILWYGVLAPAATPRNVIARVNSDIAKVLSLADVRERFASQGVDAYGSTPEEFAKLIAGDVEKWAKVIKASGVQVD